MASIQSRTGGDMEFIRTLRGQIISRDEEVELICRIQTGDESAVEPLVRSHSEKILFVANCYKGFNLDLWDRYSVGRTGFLEAVVRFDVSRGFRLWTYAHWWVRQAITRTIANESTTIRAPVHAWEMRSRVGKAERAIQNSRDRENDGYVHDEEIAVYLAANYPKIRKVGYEVTLGRIRLARHNPAFQPSRSMEAPVETDSKTSFGETVPCPSPDSEKTQYDKELGRAIASALSRLPPRDEAIIRCRLIEKLSLTKTSERIGNPESDGPLTKERIRQLEAKALKSLRKMLMHLHEEP